MTKKELRTAIRAPFLAALSAVLLWPLAGCEPTLDPAEDNSGEITSTGQEVVTIDFGVMGYDSPTPTKAYSADVEDGLVDRIDIFMYDKDGWVYGHKIIGEYGGGALDLTKVSFTDSDESGVQRYYLIIANLDPDSAQYIGYLDKIDLIRYPEGFIPWSAGNCRVNYPLMGATGSLKFGTTTSLSVSLMRYMSKFEIGTISAEFWGSPDLYRNVYVQHIAFVNAWDLVRICQTSPQAFNSSPTCIFGPTTYGTSSDFGSPSYHYYMANCFLGQDEWTTYGMTYADMANGSYNQGTWGGKGKLKQDYKYFYNNNYMQPKNTINLDCPESLKALSQHTWNTNAYQPQTAGKLCSDIDGYLGPLNVNRAFYTLPTKFNAWFTEPMINADSQNKEQRLVLAVKINGRLYFYSKMLTGLNPNMCYKIKNITLKGEPGEYANIWIKGGQVTKGGDASASLSMTEGMPDMTTGCHSETHRVEESGWRQYGNTVEIDNLVL